MTIPRPRGGRLVALLAGIAVAALPFADGAAGLGAVRPVLVIAAPGGVALLLALPRPSTERYLGAALWTAGGVGAGTLAWGMLDGPAGRAEAILLPFEAATLWVMGTALAYIAGMVGIMIGSRRARRPSPGRK